MSTKERLILFENLWILERVDSRPSVWEVIESLLPHLRQKLLIQNNPKNVGLPQKKCAYHNSGYCKFSGRKLDAEITTQKKYTKLQNVEIKNFKKYTQKSANSKKNAKPEPKQNVCEEIKSLIEDVDTLKKEISNTKVENDIQINNLVKVQLPELEEIGCWVR